jgi:predicted helicase
MMTPYVLGHLKMKTLLDKNEYPMSNERVRLFLTNTLDTRGGEQSSLSDIGRALSDEAVCVSRVRSKKPILAVIGNPPYSRLSANKGIFDNEVDIYKKNLIDESVTMAILDDYIKFIRFAHKQIDDQGEGVIGFVTNNSYLGGIIYRGMREELMKSFDEIYILNLRGRAMVDPSNDKNVFNIKQGVSIAIFVKTSNNTDDAKVYYSELIGSREYKYDYLDGNDINTTEWIELDVCKPYYFFEPKDMSAQDDYDRFVALPNIFNKLSTGIITSRDAVTIQKTEAQMESVVSDFSTLTLDDVQTRYNMPDETDTKNWNIRNAMDDVKDMVKHDTPTSKILYRPFDIQYTLHPKSGGGFMHSPCKSIMQHMAHDNIGMLVCRQQIKTGFYHLLVSNNIVAASTVSNRSKEGNNICPLYLYTNNTKTPNIAPTIITSLTTSYNTTPTPEDIFYYIYGILHSNTYRQKYAELLKIDFPKIPFTTDHDMFMRVGSIGKQLADIHLMKPEVFNNSTIKYCGRGAHKVEKITYDESTQRVSINKTQYFDGISKDVWEYQIGGYKPMQKWLKDRRHDILTADDVDHYRYIGAALARTMQLQTEIDEVYGEIDAGEIIEFASDNAQTTL